MPAWRSPAWRNVLKLLFGLLLVGILFWRLDIHQILNTFRQFSWPYLLAALGLFVLSWPIATARWQLFAPRFAFRHLFELTLIGQFYAVVLPGQIAGEAVKAYRLAKGSADAERLAASVAMDRMIGTITLLLVAAGGMALTPHAIPGPLRQIFLWLIVLLIGGLFVFNIPAIHAMAEKTIVRAAMLPRLQRLSPVLLRLIHAWRDFARAPWRLLASLLLGLMLQFIALGMYSILAINLGLSVSLSDWAWIVGVTSLAMLLPVSIGGIGLREGSLVGCLGYLGVAGEPAIALSLAIFAITLAGALIGGVIELAPCWRH
ncbi:lysylphosphatidylglycerol synthase transmembrane domain-containing protein [Dokdonella soli]|uniref:lysylphosphatidylglycerol synthase transmembrane domain-containing protein n=1 Tax=Dokdonella soli TaxID=529810 RepID=UPI0031D3D581